MSDSFNVKGHDIVSIGLLEKSYIASSGFGIYFYIVNKLVRVFGFQRKELLKE